MEYPKNPNEVTIRIKEKISRAWNPYFTWTGNYLWEPINVFVTENKKPQGKEGEWKFAVKITPPWNTNKPINNLNDNDLF